ncbi:1425_t:CDS:2 [Cetraspora pellucida]|uniref:1425_t:CDS:1 n=1 Tax=Cetraspora pellucida TaxID=1433469 RepID=A0ACA9Q5G9_9GLOM|nr:1425_t:CDS:2 [Cetraspora pellucida]
MDNFFKIFNDIFSKDEYIFDHKKKYDPKIIIITDVIGAGKTELSKFLAEYLQGIGKKILFDEEKSLELKKELSIYYEVLKKEPNDQGIIFWYQDKLITKYKEYYDSIVFENYDYIIFDRTYLDTIFFTKAGITKDIYKEMCLPYLQDNLEEINFKYRQKVIGIFVTPKVAIERIVKRDRGLEKNVSPEYFNLIHDTYNKNIDSVYPVHFSFDNNEDLKQETFLNLFDKYNKNIEVVSKKYLPLEGTNNFYDKVRKECSKHVNEIRNLVNAREEYEEKLKFKRIENENKKLQQQITEQAEMLKTIMEQMENQPSGEIVKRVREESISSDNHIGEELNKKIKLYKVDDSNLNN